MIKTISVDETLDLTTNEAIILQQIHEDGEDDTDTLAQMLDMSRPSIMNVVAHLKKRGLISIDDGYDGLWVRLTKKGRQFMNYIWPESLKLSVGN